MSSAQPGALDQTQIDDTVLAMVPAWQIGTARFESDALAFTSASPSWAIGYDSSNHASTLTGHAPPKTIAYAEVHDVGQALTAILAKFRALPEAKAAFDSFDQAVAVLGGSEAAFGWIGDVALDVAPGADGTIGGGILIQPKDADAAKRFFTTIGSALQLAGGSSGLAVRTEDHGGTPITIVDFSKVAGTSEAHLPPGYKPEIAWAFTPDVAVIGYGSDFVASVLDAGPGPSLADDARFQDLVKRVGAENLSMSFVDVTRDPRPDRAAHAEGHAGRQVGRVPEGIPTLSRALRCPDRRRPQGRVRRHRLERPDGALTRQPRTPSTLPAPQTPAASPMEETQHRWQSASG